MPLRPYQQECLKEICDRWAEGIENQLVALPTGTGKTVLFANLPEYLGKFRQMLVLVHRDKLVQQNTDKLKKYNPHLTVDVEAGGHRADVTADVIVASIQTLQHEKRRERFNPVLFQIVIVDEAHHVISPSYTKVLEYFQVYKGAANRAPGKLLCGFTATPKRGDSIGLEKVFDKIVFARSIRECVEAGWLVEPVGYRVSTLTDISHVGTTAGDFKEGQLSDAVDTFERNLLVVQEYEKLAAGMTFAAFTVTIQHSKDLADVFRSHGISCEAISGETKDAEREVLYRKHESGELLGLCSCGVLSEGWDCLDLQTEVLGADGWKNYTTLRESDQLYSLNTKTGLLEVTPCLSVGKRPVRTGEMMIAFNSQHFDIRATEGHRMYSSPYSKKPARLVKAGQLEEQRKPYGFQIGAPPADSMPDCELTDDEIRLLGWVLTDGHIGQYSIEIYQSKETWRRIKAILDRLGMPYRHSVKSNRKGYGSELPLHRFGFKRRHCRLYLALFLYKLMGRPFHLLSRRQFLILWEEMVAGDGSKQVRKAAWLWTPFKAVADEISHLAIARGFSCSFHTRPSKAGVLMYQISVRENNWIYSQPRDKRATRITRRAAEPGEWVWCAETANGTLVTRRNGKIVITGNCPRCTVGLGTRPTKSPALFIQQLGRQLRPYPAPEDREELHGLGGAFSDYVKKFAIWIDFCDNTGRHSIVTLPSLFGLRADFDLAGKGATRTTKQLEDLLKRTPGLDIGDYTSLRQIEALVHKVDLLGPIKIPAEVSRMSKFGWVKDGIAGYRLSLPDRTFYINQDVLGQWEVQENIEGHARIVFAGKQADAFQAGDAAVPRDAIGLVLAAAKWLKEPPTDKQCWALYYRDGGLHHKYYSGVALYQFALKQYAAGNTEWSKGGVSNRLNALAEAKKAKA